MPQHSCLSFMSDEFRMKAGDSASTIAKNERVLAEEPGRPAVPGFVEAGVAIRRGRNSASFSLETDSTLPMVAALAPATLAKGLIAKLAVADDAPKGSRPQWAIVIPRKPLQRRQLFNR